MCNHYDIEFADLVLALNHGNISKCHEKTYKILSSHSRQCGKPSKDVTYKQAFEETDEWVVNTEERVSEILLDSELSKDL